MQTLVYILITGLYGYIAYYLWNMLFHKYVKTKNAEFVANYAWITLEVKIPRDVSKSPAAMEVVLEAFYQGGGLGTWFDKFWKGNMLSWFSLEIASIGGQIYFFIRTHKKFKNIIESHIYAQYPNIEIHEVQDYTKRIKFDTKTHNLTGTHFVLTGKDYLPVKTYVDYGLEGGKEETKIDPMTPMLEFMGSLRPGEEVWYQILLRSDKFIKWKDDARKAVADMMKRTDKSDEAKTFTDGKLTQGEKETIKVIEKSITKNGFEVFIRALYLAEKDKFDGSRGVAFMNMMKSFGSPAFNGFAPQDDTSFAFPWQDNKKGDKIAKKKSWMFKTFVRRTFGEYMGPFDSFSVSYEIQTRVDKLLRHGIKYRDVKAGKSSFILNTEELATLYHFPGQVAATPAFKRISSTKAEAPLNLPI